MIKNYVRGRKKEYYFDYSLVFVLLFLLGFGLIMVYSTTSYDASMIGKAPTYYLKHQAMAMVGGIILMILVSFIPYNIFSKFALSGYIFSAVIILLVLTPLGREFNGARRWIYIGGISVQPSELGKIAIIVFVATLMCKLGNKVRTPRGFWTVFLAPAPICLMVWKITENVSSAIIIFAIGVIILFVSTPDYKRFIILIILGILGAGLLVFIIVSLKDSEAIGVRGERILAWLDLQTYSDTKGFQVLQSLYSIGSGGVLGKGLGQSMQKLGFLPEAQNDMIFSIICEELGLFGGLSIIVLFIILLWRMTIVAMNAKDLFGSLLVVGVIGHIAVQVIFNIAVATSVIPNTGISLPFISYGGTSVLLLLIEMGIVFSVARRIELRD